MEEKTNLSLVNKVGRREKWENEGNGGKTNLSSVKKMRSKEMKRKKTWRK